MGNMDKSIAAKTLLSFWILPTVQEGVSLSIGGVTIPNQSSVAKAHEQFDETGRMRPSPYYDRLADGMEELLKFTLLTRGVSDYLTSRYSERKEEAEKRAGRPGLKAL